MVGLPFLAPRDPLQRNALFLMLNSAIPSGWGLLFWLVAARAYPARDVGLATALFPAAGLIASLSTLGLTVGFVRFLPSQGARAKDTINASLTFSALLALLGGATFALVAGNWSSDLAVLRGDPLFGGTFVVYTVAASASSLVDSALVAQGRSEYVFLKTNLFGLSRVPLPLVLASLGLAGSSAVLVSFGAGTLLALALGVLYLLPRAYHGYRLVPRLKGGSLRPMLSFSLANHGANVVGLIPGTLIPLLILTSISPEGAAHYYVALIGAGIIFAVSGSAATSLLAEGSRSGASLGPQARRAWVFILALQVPAVAAALLLANGILDLFQRGYSAAAPMLQLLTLASFFVAFNNVYLARKRIEKRNWTVLWVVGLGSALQLLFTLFLLRPWGLTGVGSAFLLAQGTTSAVILLSRWLPGMAGAGEASRG